MDYEAFQSYIVNSLQKHFGDTASISLQPIVKNNQKQLDGLMIQDFSINITPTIYLNYYYDDYLAGQPLSDILEDIIASYRDNLPAQNMDFSFFTDYEKVKYRIVYKLINRRKNKELLSDVPYFCFLDLAVVFCCYLPDTPHGNATILIHNHHLKLWGVHADDLYDLALTNTPILLPYELKSMEDILHSFHPEHMDLAHIRQEISDAPTMYVLSNTEKLYGASALLYPKVIPYFAQMMDCDFFILPSSIHEILLLPKEPGCCIADLNCIVQEVNRSQVLAEEVLSDHVYTFERSLGFISH